MKAHRLGLCTETLLLIYGGRASLFQFNFPEMRNAPQRYPRIDEGGKFSSPLFKRKNYIFNVSPISSCVSTLHITAKQLTNEYYYEKMIGKYFLAM